MNKKPKEEEILKEFDEKFPYSAVEYNAAGITKDIFGEVRKFLQETIIKVRQDERERIIKGLDHLEIYNLDQDGDFGEQYEEVRDELLDRVRKLINPLI